MSRMKQQRQTVQIPPMETVIVPAFDELRRQHDRRGERKYSDDYQVTIDTVSHISGKESARPRERSYNFAPFDPIEEEMRNIDHDRRTHQCLSSSSSRSPTSSRVSFNPVDEVVEGLHILDYSWKERIESWYSEDEILSSLHASLPTSFHPRSRELSDGDLLHGYDRTSDCFRFEQEFNGESSPPSYHQKQQEVYLALEKIQTFERSKKVTCRGLISSLCAKWSEESIIKARHAAVIDLMAARCEGDDYISFSS